MRGDETFPVRACAYSRRLAAISPRFALQVYDPPGAGGARRERFGPDPFGELSGSQPCPGLKRRFPDRVLVMATDRCFMTAWT